MNRQFIEAKCVNRETKSQAQAQRLKVTALSNADGLMEGRIVSTADSVLNLFSGGKRGLWLTVAVRCRECCYAVSAARSRPPAGCRGGVAVRRQADAGRQLSDPAISRPTSPQARPYLAGSAQPHLSVADYVLSLFCTLH